MKKKNNYSLRKFINDIHLWLGLASGIILFVVCFTGTVLVFEHEIKDFFAEELKVEATKKKQTIESLIKTLQSSNNGYISSFTIPHQDSEPYVFYVKKDLKERRGTEVLVNPYNQELLKVEKTNADAFMLTLFKLHRWLLLDTQIGRPIVGVATIIFLLLSISGIVLWFPKKMSWRNIKQGLKIKTHAKWKRVNHDLHNTLGFYACLLLLIMAITGLCWSFDGYREGLGHVIGTKIFDRSSPQFETINTTNANISIDEIIKIANETLDYKGNLSVTFPNKEDTYFSIRKYNEDNLSPVTSDRLYLSISGEILKVEKFKDKPLNQKIAALIKPIHTGEIFGTFSKIIYFLVCLIATSLPVTGTIIWINKMKTKSKKKIKK